jgi:hypothetical protein
MDRRSLLRTGALVAAASSGLAGATRADAAGPAPLVEWDLTGGFVGPGFDLLRPPVLVIYPGGLAIADAARRLRLDRPEQEYAAGHALTVLRNPANGHRRPGAPVIADVPATVFQARGATGHRYSIRADGLAESRGSHAYPAPLYSLLDHLSSLRDRILKSGQQYRGSGVRLVAVPAPGATGAVRWPTGVPVPTLPDTGVSGYRDLGGTAARAVLDSMPRRDPWQWAVYRLPDGRLLRATWRYLLPHEPVR